MSSTYIRRQRVDGPRGVYSRPVRGIGQWSSIGIDALLVQSRPLIAADFLAIPNVSSRSRDGSYLKRFRRMSKDIQQSPARHFWVQ